MLKKQTVWLLTMLSLVVVLSVYYVTSPEGGSSNMAMTDNKEPVNETEKEMVEENNTAGSNTAEQKPAEEVKTEEQQDEIKTEKMEDGTVISSVASDELFTSIRMKVEDQRNEKKEQLQAIVANKDASAEEKNEAYDEMESLADAAAKETILETLIKSKGYEDALVRAEGNDVKITVKSKKEHNPKAANDIIALVRDEMKEMDDIAVRFEPTE
ncbi:SpoIIIAH-like family protein [Metabacillus fastidiosus]|uniref:SpoIIIAH-like family protein n=1 Tax=Metabacillus fastidiosus TaxID=1458 RepID=UPI002DBC4CFE|nr:SpoIIIAH-like family protein [Metabacillus fastidiosus]MEC2075410.1 SpoIIIAH-like family protein [Metabacillus fastidiosus]